MFPREHKANLVKNNKSYIQVIQIGRHVALLFVYSITVIFTTELRECEGHFNLLVKDKMIKTYVNTACSLLIHLSIWSCFMYLITNSHIGRHLFCHSFLRLQTGEFN